MKPKWLIQTNMDGVDTETIIEEVLSQGMCVEMVRYGPFVHLDKYDLHCCTVCYGDIDFVRHITRSSKLIPGAWCNFKNMKCSTYYSYFGEHLLNQHYWIMPIGDLLRRWDDLTISFSEIDGIIRKSLFIRPDSGAKPFTGYVVSPDEKNKIQTLVEAVGPETLIIVAIEKQITAEYRFVICDGEVVTGCQYLPCQSDWFKPESFRLAYKIAKHQWQPDLCYTVDIAESNREVYLLEINSFSCASFYECDIKSIVCSASKTAMEEWKSYL